MPGCSGRISSSVPRAAAACRSERVNEISSAGLRRRPRRSRRRARRAATARWKNALDPLRPPAAARRSVSRSIRRPGSYSTTRCLPSIATSNRPCRGSGAAPGLWIFLIAHGADSSVADLGCAAPWHYLRRVRTVRIGARGCAAAARPSPSSSRTPRSGRSSTARCSSKRQERARRSRDSCPRTDSRFFSPMFLRGRSLEAQPVASIRLAPSHGGASGLRFVSTQMSVAMPVLSNMFSGGRATGDSPPASRSR